MLIIVFGFLCLLLALVTVALQRLYSVIPQHELKRLAAGGDKLAQDLYSTAAYGPSLRGLLWVGTALGLAFGFASTMPALPYWAGIVLSIIVSLCMFVLVPMMQLTERSAVFAGWCARLLVPLLRHVHVPLHHTHQQVSRMRTLTPHTRLYEHDDMVRLLQQQATQGDNRIEPAALTTAQMALNFPRLQAADVLTVRRVLTTLKADDSLGPVLLDQLHKSGSSAFVVCDAKGAPIGIVDMRDALSARKGGKVAVIMHTELCFVHEDDPLPMVLQACLQSGQRIVLVHNTASDWVGAIELTTLIQTLCALPEPAKKRSASDTSPSEPAPKEPQQPDNSKGDNAASSPAATEVVQ